MGHGSPLTDDELQSYELPGELTRYLDQFATERGRAPESIRVLDWGCGRGLAVAALRARGYDAYGVDVDPAIMNFGRERLEADARLKSEHLLSFDAGGRTPFPDGHFDFITSWYVFEHVADLNCAISEIQRLSADDAGGFHVLPAPLRPIEGHLFMPFVHWLPKSGLRRGLIGALTRLGVEPNWPHVATRSSREKAAAYFDYSVSQTFYYRWPQLREAFTRHGFRAHCVSLDHPTFSARSSLRTLARLPVGHAMLDWLVTTFRTVEFVTRAPAGRSR